MITIVSGGQTGVDRAALDAAIKLNIPQGGWCPKGRLAEDGIISNKYNLKETETSEYSERTKLNIRDSDGTLVIVPESLKNITDGTILTVQELKEKGKAYIIISLSEGFNINEILLWMKQNQIKTLNIAGPRESQCPGIYSAALHFMENFLSILKWNMTKENNKDSSHLYSSAKFNSENDVKNPFLNKQEKSSTIDDDKKTDDQNTYCISCNLF